MNQQDYEKIAEIMKEEFVCGYEQGLNGAIHSKNCRKCKVAKKLAYYFEEEEYKRHTSKQTKVFNRKQFLKDCGVQESKL